MSTHREEKLLVDIDEFENKEFLDKIKEFSENEVAKIAKKLDLTDEFPVDTCEKMHDLKLFSLLIPREYGGEGLSLLHFSQALYTISKYSASIGLLIICHTVGLLPVIFYGSEEQKNKYFKEVIDNRKLFAFSITEPKAGSDAASIEATALKDGKDYILNGIKSFITNVGKSDYYTMFFKTEPEKGSRGMSCFIVDKNLDGFKIISTYEKIGMRGIPCGNVKLDNVRISKSELIGEEGIGFKIAMDTLNTSRPFIGAQAIGIAEYAFEKALRFASRRRQFGKPIAKHQAVMFKLAKMATKVEAAKSIVRKACYLLDNDDHEKTKFSAMCKAFATDVAMENSIDAMQIYGGYSTYRDGDIERLMRDAKITQIFEGSNEIQNMIIGNQLYKEAGIKFDADEDILPDELMKYAYGEDYVSSKKS